MSRIALHSALFCLLLAAGMSAACGPAVPAATQPPTLPPLTGEVSIETPAEASIIYSELLYISGTAQGLPDEGFLLVVLGMDDAVITETRITPAANQWSVEIPHGHTGDPTEITIVALPAAEGVVGAYDQVTVALSALEFRPPGPYGFIFWPFEGDTVGGDLLPVAGTASGIFENTIIISLEHNGSVLDEQIVTLSNPYFIDEVPWVTELATGSYTGPALIRLFIYDAQDGAQITLDSVEITISAAAG